jgi:ATP phosphoribosyltransferase
MSDPLIVAIPSKGRIMDESVQVFAKAGLTIRKAGHERGYRGIIDELPGVAVAFLSSSEIARELGAGNAHVGITGLDLVHENVPSWADRVEVLNPLGFGKADVVVAVPQSWIDVTSVADLENVALSFRRVHGRRPRIATKFVNLTRRFLAANGITSWLVVESLGATEGTPAAGTAEIIVDITETGDTLKANHLKVLGQDIILRSEAVLVRSKTAPWSKAALAELATLRARLDAVGPAA